MNQGFLLGLCLLAATPGSSAQTRVDVLIPTTLEGWKSKVFKGETQYKTQVIDGMAVVKAEAHATASGLFREIEIDLRKTPFLNWRWKVENTFDGNNERSKSGDDYPARVYVVVSGGALFWRTRALNYVWSSNQPIGTQWPNAFTNNAMMLAVTSGPPQATTWVTVKRHVRDDLRLAFGRDIDTVDAVAIMTDADNTLNTVTGYYGEIFFSAQ